MEASGEPLVIPETLWPEVAEQQLARMEIDPWEELIEKWLAERQERNSAIEGCFIRAATKDGRDYEWRVSTSYLLTTVIGIPIERQYQSHATRLAAVMRNLGWTRPDKTMRINKTVCRGFTRLCSVTPSRHVSHVIPAKYSRPAILDRRFAPQELREEAKLNVTAVTSLRRNF